MRLRAVRGKGIASPNRVALVHPTVLREWGLEAQSQILLKTTKARQVVWVYPGEQNTSETESSENSPDTAALQQVEQQTILLSKRAHEALGDEPELEVDVE